MKILHSAAFALAIGLASVSSAQARDSFSLGINIGGFGYGPPVAYYPAPPIVYYDAPIVHYRHVPRYYGYAPLVSYRYFDGGRRGHHYGHRHWDRGGRHNGWRDGGGNRRGHRR